MEADLSLYHHIDYRDRWRFDAAGRRKLTLRRISVLVSHLPGESASAIASGGSGWRLEHVLAADIFGVLAGERHPDYPVGKTTHSPEREKRLRQGRVRAQERRRAIEAGEIT